MQQSQRSSQSSLPDTNASPKHSGTPRKENILLAATELFSARPHHDIEEQKIFLELARNFLPETCQEDRRRIAGLLASHPEIPADILEQLASDSDALTAYPALRYSQRLSVDLLVGIARSGPDTLRKAIALRTSLSESVLLTLCNHAGPDVIRILLERSDIQLSATQKEHISRRTDIVASMGAELDGQNALSPDGLMSQFLHLPAKLRAKALAAAETASLIRQAQAPGKVPDPRSLSSRMHLHDALITEALAQNRSRFSDLLSQGLGLPQSTCDLLLRGDQSDSLTIALKAVGMSNAQTATVLLRFLGKDLKLEDLRTWLRLHRTLSHGAAQLLVSQWLLVDLGSTAPDNHVHETQFVESEHQRQGRSHTGNSSEDLATRDADRLKTGTHPRPAA